jgi:hypothetical protein
MLLKITRSIRKKLPYDGMTRTGSEGISHSTIAETPSEVRNLLERREKHKMRDIYRAHFE